MNGKTHIITTILIIVLITTTLYFLIKKANRTREIKKKAFYALKENNYDEAIRLAKLYIDLAHESAFPHQIMSQCYYRKGITDEALKHANLAISYFPKNQNLYYLRRQVLLKKGDYPRGCMDVTRTINARRELPTSKQYTIDNADSFFNYVSYRDLLAMRIKYCGEIMPDQVKIDREILGNSE